MDSNTEERMTRFNGTRQNSDPTEPALFYVHRRSISGQDNTAAVPESANAPLETRLKEFAPQQSTASPVAQTREDSLKELQRRQTERESRRHQEEGGCVRRARKVNNSSRHPKSLKQVQYPTFLKASLDH